MHSPIALLESSARLRPGLRRARPPINSLTVPHSMAEGSRSAPAHGNLTASTSQRRVVGPDVGPTSDLRVRARCSTADGYQVNSGTVDLVEVARRRTLARVPRGGGGIPPPGLRSTIGSCCISLCARVWDSYWRKRPTNCATALRPALRLRRHLRERGRADAGPQYFEPWSEASPVRSVPTGRTRVSTERCSTEGPPRTRP